MKKVQKDSITPFYASSTKHKTSSEIINEARAVIQKVNVEDINQITGGSGAPRTLTTQRPFTPRERQRTLFGKVGRNSRPPSAVSLKYLQQNNENTKISSNLLKKGQLSPVTVSLNSSIDDKLFHQLLENIDEKPELTNSKKKREDMCKSKSLSMEVEYGDECKLMGGSKLKLPSLYGHAKPLHQRKESSQQLEHAIIINNSQTSDEINVDYDKSLKESFTSKSTELQNSLKMIETVDNGTEHLPNIKSIGSSEIFHTKRLFNNFKSKNENKNKPVLVYENIAKMKTNNSETNAKNIHEFKSNIDFNDLSAKSNSVKIDVQIPSPEACHQKKENLKINSKLTSIFNILENLSNKEAKTLTDEDIIEMLLILYNTLENEDSWQNIGGDEKAIILKVLYNYVESTNECLLIAIARIILALRVTGSNLSGVCKLVFKVARNDKNDHLFIKDNILDLFMVGLGRAEPLHDAECLVYGYGALKFLGMNPILLERMRSLGVLPLMTLHLKMFNEARTDDIHSVGEQGCHGLYQLTGALRNMAGNEITWNSNQLFEKTTDNSLSNCLMDFLSGGTLNELCRTIGLFSDDLDIEINVSRTLSVLSADFECCVALCNQKKFITAVVKLLKLYTDRAPLIVRLTYILGNMVACNNDTRMDLFNEHEATEVLLKVLNMYLKRCWPVGKIDSAENIIIGSDLDGSNGSDEDVMVKCIRIVANMCMNPIVGSRFAEYGQIGDQVLSWILKCLRQHSPADSTELITSTLAALNNLSYYYSGEDFPSTAFGGLQIHICEVLCRFLLQDVGSCTTEAARVLGNMTRSKITRDYVVDTGALLNIMQLTEHEEQETSLAAAGILVNMAADEDARKAWIEMGGIREAVKSLRIAASQHQWLLAHLMCQALWNAIPLPNTDISLLTPLLLDILDEQQVFGTSNFRNISLNDIQISDNISPQDGYILNRLAWEEFAMVAVNLLDKIDPNMDSPYDEKDIFFKSDLDISSDLIPI